MRCLECIKENKRSIVTQGITTSYAIYRPIQYDENGHLIQNTNKDSQTQYSCSNGHSWSE